MARMMYSPAPSIPLDIPVQMSGAEVGAVDTPETLHAAALMESAGVPGD